VFGFEGDVSIDFLSDCPDPNQSDVNLLDVQSEGYVYQDSSSQFVVVQGENVYGVNSLIAKFGNSLAFANYAENTLYLVDQVGLNQIVLETYTITSGSKIGTNVLSVQGQISKAGDDAVLYTVNQLNGTTAVKVFNFTTQSITYSALLSTTVSSISATRLNSEGLESFVYLDNSANLWMSFDGQITQIGYEQVGNVQVQASGNGQFTVTAWNSGIQINNVFSVYE
jgi:hypothetical protein